MIPHIEVYGVHSELGIYGAPPRIGEPEASDGDLDLPMLLTWRKQLRPIVINTLAQELDIDPDEITAHFPHDPSVPDDENPPVTVKVYLDTSDLDGESLFDTIRNAKVMMEIAVADFVKALRRVEGVRVRVLLHNVDQALYYETSDELAHPRIP